MQCNVCPADFKNDSLDRLRSIVFNARMKRAEAVTCPKCDKAVPRSDEHYVSAVGHMTDPTDAITPYWTCQV